MALTGAYLQTTKNLQGIINSLVSAKAPERLTNKFLEDLGYKSTNDRVYISVFKALGLLDENAVPTQRYHQFLDQSETGKVLAIGIQEAYEDLFALRKDAQTLSIDELKGKLKTLTQGQKSDNTITLMANTFKALCDAADWSTTQNSNQTKKIPTDSTSIENVAQTGATTSQNIEPPKHIDGKMNLHYNIQIHLPETTNMAVYDAIFQSLQKHLI
ncbi:MAG: DUF5343 domain-containing protein [Bacillota bacterium]|nr:DUF5343 domain-containing protein [Bacillota bacterium]